MLSYFKGIALGLFLFTSWFTALVLYDIREVTKIKHVYSDYEKSAVISKCIDRDTAVFKLKIDGMWMLHLYLRKEMSYEDFLLVADHFQIPKENLECIFKYMAPDV